VIEFLLSLFLAADEEKLGLWITQRIPSRNETYLTWLKSGIMFWM